MRSLVLPLILLLAWSCAHEEDETAVEVIPPPAPVVVEKMPAPKAPVPMAPPLAPAPAAKPAVVVPAETLEVAAELPKPVAIMVKNAEAQLRLKQLPMARAQAERAYRMESRDPRISYLLGRIAAAEGDYQDAEQWGQRALESSDTASNKDVIWRFIARCRQKQGDSRGAEDALHRQR